MKVANSCGIYKIKNLITNMCYIGQSINCDKRWNNAHKPLLMERAHYNKHLQRAWNKYGKDNFTFEIIFLCNRQDLNDSERYFIDSFDSFNNGYNLRPGGDSSFMVSEETRGKISKNHADVSGKNNPMYGRTHTDEVKIKTSLRFKGKPLQSEAKEKLSLALTGRVFTEEHKINLGNSIRGKRHSEDTIQKMIESGRNKTFSETHKLNISKACGGEKNGFFGRNHTEEYKQKARDRVVTEEAKEKMRQAWIKRKENKSHDNN